MSAGSSSAAGRLALPQYAAIAAIAILLHIQTLGRPFVYDDVTEIQANPGVHRLASIPTLVSREFWHGTPGWGSIYRPITAASIPPLFVLGGGRTWPFHLSNLLLHAVTCCLLASVVSRLSGRGRAACLSGILFAIHPIHTESVAWISGRSELLFAATGAAAWWFHLRATRNGSGWSAAAAAVLLALSLGSKETAVCLPFIFLAADAIVVSPRPASRARWGAALPVVYLATIGGWLAWRYALLGRIGKRLFEGASLLNPLDLESWWPARPFTAARVLGLAAMKSLVPGAPCIDYGFNQVPVARGPGHLDVLIVMAACAAAAFCAWRVLRREARDLASRLLVMSSVVFLLAWLPVSNLLVTSVSIFAERNLYLPSFGVCLAAAVLADAALSRAGRYVRPAWACLAAAAAAVCVSAYGRQQVFTDEMALFSAAATHCEDSARAHFLHATALDAAGRSEETIAACRRALAIAPDYVDARALLSGALSRSGKKREAAEEASAALSASPASVESRLAVIAALSGAGLEEKSQAALDDLMSERGSDPSVRFLRGRFLQSQGKLDDALALFETMRNESPEAPAGFVGIGAVHMARGETSAAKQAFADALRLDPYDPSALYNLGVIALHEASSTPTAAGEARRFFERYTVMAPRDVAGWTRLAQACELSGDLSCAEESIGRAVTIRPGDEGLRDDLQRIKRRRTSPAGG